jgi:myo-inositol 2-dehydrogenase/D-chiro-inositol 1-dehydrogenase
MTVRFGLLGAGRIGKVHAQAVTGDRRARLVAVADAVPEAATALAAQYGAEVRSIDAIAGSADIDAVLICTPTTLHAAQIVQFARAGKAVFCEKPIDLSLDRVRETLKIVRETGAKLMIGFNRRFDPHFAALKKIILSGEIGAVEMVHIISRDPAAPPLSYIRTSGGMLRDMTIHDFDMARFLLGEDPEQISAQASVLTDPAIGKAGDVDSALVTLRTASGKLCTIANSRRATYGYDQRIEVHGSKGMVAAENPRELLVEVANRAGYTRAPLHDFFMTRYTAAYAAEIAAFVKVVEDGAMPSPSGQDGLMALALADAAYRSIAENRTVRLSEILG